MTSERAVQRARVPRVRLPRAQTHPLVVKVQAREPALLDVLQGAVRGAHAPRGVLSDVRLAGVQNA